MSFIFLLLLLLLLLLFCCAPSYSLSPPYSVSLSLSLSLSSSSQSINVSLHSIDCTLSLGSSNVGNVSVDQLQGLISLVIALVEPMINKKLSNMSIPVPSLGAANLTNSEIVFVEDGQYLLVASNVVLGNLTSDGELYVEQKELGGAATALKGMATHGHLAQWFYHLTGLFPR